MKEPYYFKDMDKGQRIKWCLGIVFIPILVFGFIAAFGFIVSKLLDLF